MKDVDGRADGLNNKGYPLRKIVEEKDGLHFLECGHVLAPVSDSYVRSRRCLGCAGVSDELIIRARRAADEITNDHLRPCEQCFGDALADVKQAIVAVIIKHLGA